jgi:hypothetical protein
MVHVEAMSLCPGCIIAETRMNNRGVQSCGNACVVEGMAVPLQEGWVMHGPADMIGSACS